MVRDDNTDDTKHSTAAIEESLDVDALEIVDGQVLAAASAGEATIVIAAPADSPPPADALRTSLRALTTIAQAHAELGDGHADGYPSFGTAAGLRPDDRARTDGGGA